MDKRTYKAARRSIIATGLKDIADGLYGLRMTCDEQEYFDSMMEENVIEVELEDEEE